MMSVKLYEEMFAKMQDAALINASLDNIENGGIHKCFIEMSMCTASCIHGPALSKNYDETIQGYINVSKSAGKEDFEVSDLFYKDIKKTFEKKYLFKAVPSEEDIQNVLNDKFKTFNKIILAIENSKNNSLERLIFGLGIRDVGATCSLFLARCYKNIDNLLQATKEELVTHKDIGEIVSTSIYD